MPARYTANVEPPIIRLSQLQAQIIVVSAGATDQHEAELGQFLSGGDCPMIILIRPWRLPSILQNDFERDSILKSNSGKKIFDVALARLFMDRGKSGGL